MIERDTFDGDIFEVACDSCSEDIEIDTGGDWQKLIQKLKDRGWRMRKIEEEWHHYCPVCVSNKKVM